MSLFNIGQKFEKVMGKEQELLEAARSGNLATIEKLLQNKSKKSSAVGGGGIGHKLSSFLKSVNVNCTDKNGYTALHHAAVNGHRDVVEALLRADAQPGLLDQQGCTPVHLAAWNGNPEIVMQLLMAGSIVDPGVTPLVTPVQVNHQNGSGDTALHSAAQYGHMAVVDVLLQKLANPTIRNLSEASPLDLAAQYGRLEVVQLLLIKHPDLVQRPLFTQSTLHMASRNGHRDIVEVLLDNKFNINTVLADGSALHEAALHGKFDVVRLLLDRGIDVNIADSKGQTVLQLLSAHQSQQKSFTEIIQAIRNSITRFSEDQSTDSGLYDSLSSCSSGHHGDKPMATVKPLPQEKQPPTDKPVLKPPDKPVPSVRRSMIRLSPDQPGPPSEPVTPLYSKPFKEKKDETDNRETSSTNSITDHIPPPLPPRSSIFAVEDKTPAQTDPASRVKVPETSPKSNMVVPKKPPRQKKSPVPVRRSPPTETPNLESPSSPTSTLPSNTLPSNQPSSTLPSNALPSNQSSNQPSNKTAEDIPDKSNIIPNINITITKEDSDKTNTSQHSTTQEHSKNTVDQSEKTDLKTSQSKSHKYHSGPHPPISPKPVLPPRTSVAVTKVDNSIDPQTGTQVNQAFYMDMKAVKPSAPVKPITNINTQSDSKSKLKPEEAKVDNYGILFPKFKNKTPEKIKKPLFRRTNTAPEENVYIEPSPTSPLSQFKDREKKGLLRRTNTAPEESVYTVMSGPSDPPPPQGHGGQGQINENLYAEIPEKSPKLSSPTENIYATIPETKKEIENNVYSQISDLTPPTSPNDKVDNSQSGQDDKGVNSPVSETEGKDSNSSSTKLSDGESKPDLTVSVKPNYLDFIKGRNSSTPITPTGYPQPPTPDFPPPSPATAMMGIELKIQEMDTKRKSRDIDTITDESLESIQERSQTPEVKDSSKGQSEEVKDTCKVQSSEVKDTTLDKNSEDKDIPKGQNSELKDTPKGKFEVKDTCKGQSSEIKDTTLDKSPEDKDTPKGQNSEVKDTPKGQIKKIRVSSIKYMKVDQEQNKVEVTVTEGETKVTSVEETVKTTEKQSMGAEQSLVQKTEELKLEDSEKHVEKSVIQSEITKEIPVSSIPNTPVIKVEIEKMSENNSKSDKTIGAQSVVEMIETQSKDDLVKKAVTPEASPVMMRRKSSSSSNPDLDIFKGLLRGSTIGGPPKVVSQFYDNVLRANQAGNRSSRPATLLTFDPLMEKDDDIDIDQVMKSIDIEVAKRASGVVGHESTAFDDSEEWAKIADIMSSFGGNLTPSYCPDESKFNSSFESYMDKLLTQREEGSEMLSVGEWLESLQLGQYENSFVANGFDNVDYLDHKVMEEQDLEQIGVLNYDHRQQILQSAKHLPQLKPIDPSNPPATVEEWLLSLQLLDYLDTFTSHGYDTMEKVESILWELQLRTVLDISMLGHRKRILASLGERHPPDRQNSLNKKKSLTSMNQDETKSRFNDINLFKDYTRVKPVSSSEEDIKESTQMVVDSSEEEDVFKKTDGKSIRNSNIHLRPPHMAQTSSPARQWRHKPEMLIKGCCNYTAQYLGSTMVSELTGGTDSTRAGITKLKLRFLHQLKKSTDVLAKIPVIMLSISYKGVKFIDAKSKKVICDHEIGNIFCACQDTDNLNFFAYITRDIQTGHHFCHVFSVKSSSLAHDIILTLGESFEVAYQMAMKDKSMTEAMELDRTMSQSDAEDTYSVSSKISTNTV